MFGRAPVIKIDMNRKPREASAANAQLDIPQPLQNLPAVSVVRGETSNLSKATPSIENQEPSKIALTMEQSPPSRIDSPTRVPMSVIENGALREPMNCTVTPSNGRSPTGPSTNAIQAGTSGWSKHAEDEDTLVVPDFKGLNITEGVEQPNLSDTGMKPSLAPPALPNSPTQVTKPRRNRKKGSFGRRKARESNAIPAPVISSEYADLLSNLAHKEQQRQKALDKKDAKLQSKDEDIAGLMDLANDLHARLNIAQGESDQAKADLATFKGNKPRWEQTIKNFRDFVNGLSNDHNRLRDDARLIHEAQSDMQADKAEMVNAIKALKEVQGGLCQDNTKRRQVAAESRRHIELLNETVQRLQSQREDDGDLLDFERERNQRLEEEVIAIKDSHEHLVRSFQDFGETVCIYNTFLSSNLNKQTGQPQDGQYPEQTRGDAYGRPSSPTTRQCHTAVGSMYRHASRPWKQEDCATRGLA